MLTRIKARNFKRLEEIDVELGDVVVFVGPNNGGKTSALQALLLWHAGLTTWTSERKTRTAEKRPGVTIPRLGLSQVPVGDAKHLWRHLRVRNVSRDENGKQHTDNILIDITVSGERRGKAWECGLEFDYANPESFYCRPIRTAAGRMSVPEAAREERINLLPPLSGVSTEEAELQPGRVNVLLGEGRSGEVLRNLCLSSFEHDRNGWDRVKAALRDIFRVEMMDPQRDSARGIINLNYREDGVEYPITSAGSGLRQVLLLLSYLEGNPNSTLLLDEPDAHLEVLRQRQVYSLLSEIARRTNNQLIIASHSEVVMQEAIDRDLLISFVGRPRRIDDRGSQVGKALKEIRAEDYYQAERKGCVLYLEGSTDIAILRGFARILDHPAQSVLSEPFVHYVANQPIKAQSHFHGVREAKPDLRAFALFDRLDRPLPPGFNIETHMWKRRELENYLALPDTLRRFASGGRGDDLVSRAESETRSEAMNSAIESVEAALKTLGKDPWSVDTKVSDEVLTPIFNRYYSQLNLTNRISKSDFHVLVDFMEPKDIDAEVIQVLDKISSI